MFMRILDRFEEVLISFLMAAAVVLIFVAVTHRFAIGYTADIVRYSRAHDMPELAAWSRAFYSRINAIKLTWAQEACIYLFIWMAKFGAAYGVRIGIHVGVDMFINTLSDANRRIATVIAMSGGILFTGILVWIGSDFVYHVWQGGQTSADLEMPMWIVYLAVPLGSALMCFRFIQALYWYVTTGFIAQHDHGHVDGMDDDDDTQEGRA